MHLVVKNQDDAEKVRRFLHDWLCIESSHVSSGSGTHFVQVKERPEQAAMVRALRSFLGRIQGVV